VNNFNKLGLSQSTIEVLDQLGFVNPTPVQEQAIPLLLSEEPIDFIGIAQTGTGKTAAFGLPLIERIDMQNNATQALIMAPTRELGQQTAKMLVDFSKNNRKLNVQVVYGGAAISNQIRALKRPTQIVVATPGRLLDLINRRAVKLDNVKYVVLDEADEMLNMGFKEDIDKILSHTQDDRVTWLFSATMPPEIRKIINKYMDSPKEVSINTEEKVNKDITHKYVVTTVANKIPAIRRFIDLQSDLRGILFCRTRRETQKISDELGKMGYNAEAIHGDLSQGQRDRVMKRFKNRSLQLLVATDVAARGIDVDDLTHVLHHTLPDSLDYYTHRSGRTARIGKKGISLVFIHNREGRRIKELERKIGVTFEKIDVPSAEGLKSSRLNSWAKLIIDTKVEDQAEEILKELGGQFADLSKEDILKRLISSQLSQLKPQNGESANLNDRQRESSGRGDRRDARRNDRPDNRRNSRTDFKREEKRDYKHENKPDFKPAEKQDYKREDKSEYKRSNGNSQDGYNRYFINIGSMDDVKKGDLINYLSETSGVLHKYFGQMTLTNNCAYFDVDNTKDRGLSDKFKGIEIEGRSIRVNRDDDGKTTRTEVKSKKKFQSKSKKPRKKNHHPKKGRR